MIERDEFDAFYRGEINQVRGEDKMARLRFERNEESIQREADLDGIYIIRTSEKQSELSAEDTVRTYKSLGQVEQAFHCIKSIDLQVRPICHRTVDHVRAHIFLCMLAYYVQ